MAITEDALMELPGISHVLAETLVVELHRQKPLMAKLLKNGVTISGKYVRTLEIRNQISESVTNFYLNEGSVFKCRNFVTGWHHSTKIRQDLFYQSSYERDVLRFLDSDDRVTSFEWKPLKLEYHWKDGSTHRYIPDVKVVIHGFQEEMWDLQYQLVWSCNRY